MRTSHQQNDPAWLLRGWTGSIPGRLKISGSTLSYTAQGSGTLFKRQLVKLEEEVQIQGLADRLDNGSSATIMKVSLNEAKIVFPWYYFSGGLKVFTPDTSFRFSFAEPNKHATGTAIYSVSQARNTGKVWKEVLQEKNRLNN